MDSLTLADLFTPFSPRFFLDPSLIMTIRHDKHRLFGARVSSVAAQDQVVLGTCLGLFHFFCAIEEGANFLRRQGGPGHPGRREYKWRRTRNEEERRKARKEVQTGEEAARNLGIYLASAHTISRQYATRFPV